jgi:hypothetical protein
MKLSVSLAAVGVALAIAPAAAFAHHSFAMFDRAKMYTWTGTVEEFNWTNPHVHMTVNVPAGAGDPATVGRWDIEGASPNIMARQGWTRNTFKVGDHITVVGHPLKDGGKGGSLYYALDKNGKKLFHDVNRSGGPAG